MPCVGEWGASGGECLHTLAKTSALYGGVGQLLGVADMTFIIMYFVIVIKNQLLNNKIRLVEASYFC